MTNLAELKDTSRPPKKFRRVGRGVGSKKGKNAGRGEKGDSKRQGYRKRFGYEGGQVPLYRKLPVRGFTRGKFVKPTYAIGLSKIDATFKDGETVNLETLRAKGILPRRVPGGVKILANGELTKNVKIEAHHISKAAEEKLKEKGISFTKV